jgi:single-strand DNA-binding protein
MAGSFNKVILVGNLVRDPEIRYIASGAAVTKFTLAVNRRTKDKDEVDFIDVVAWEKLAEICNTYLKKGMSCLVEGRLSIRSYDDAKITDESGRPIKRKTAEIVANNMQMLDRREGGESNGGGGSSYGGGATSGSRTEPDFDDEIPF